MSHDEYDVPAYEEDYFAQDAEEYDEYRPSAVIAILDQLEQMVETARTLPMSASVLVNRAEVLELLTQAREALPGDLQEANVVLADAEDLMTRADVAAESTLDEATARAQTIVEEAQQKAATIVERARYEAEDLRTRVTEEVNELQQRTNNEVEQQLYAAQEHADFLISQENVSQQALARAEEIVAKANEHALKLTDGAEQYCAESLEKLLTVMDGIYKKTVAGQDAIEARRSARRGE